MGIQKKPCQKLFKPRVGVENYIVNFTVANRQFEWLEILLVSNKSYRHITVYESYNHELTSRTLESIEINNSANMHSKSKELKYDINDNAEKHFLYKQFFTWNCNSYSIAYLTDYASNPIF